MKLEIEVATDSLMATTIASICAITITIVAVLSDNTTIATAAIATITSIGFSTVAYIKQR